MQQQDGRTAARGDHVQGDLAARNEAMMELYAPEFRHVLASAGTISALVHADVHDVDVWLVLLGKGAECCRCGGGGADDVLQRVAITLHPREPRRRVFCCGNTIATGEWLGACATNCEDIVLHFANASQQRLDMGGDVEDLHIDEISDLLRVRVASWRHVGIVAPLCKGAGASSRVVASPASVCR